MSKYFISVYKNYLNKIESDKDLETKYKALTDKMTSFNTSFNNYMNCIDNSSWTESGKNQIINSYLPSIKSNNNIFINGILNNLSKVISLIKNDLYNMLIELKEKDNEYTEIQKQIKEDKMSSSDLEYLKGKLEALDNILVNQVKNIDKKILEIKSYNNIDTTLIENNLSLHNIDLSGTKDALLSLYNKTHHNDNKDSIIGKLKNQVEKNKINKLFDDKKEIKEEKIDKEEETDEVKEEINELDNSNCVDLSLLDASWKVINTKIDVSSYAKDIYNKGIRQNSNTERYEDHCLAFSYVHASNLYNGEIDANAECAYNWNHASEFTDFFSDDKQETLKVVYNQIKEGKPVIMQVNGNKKGTTRHFVTVVGVKSDVKNADSVKETDLLILDSWDGKLERMDTSTSRFMTTGEDTNKPYTGYYLRILK